MAFRRVAGKRARGAAAMIGRTTRHAAATGAFLLSTALCAGRAAAALTVDGKLDPEYGPPVVVQSIQTDLTGTQFTGDNTDNDLNFAGGSELDGAYAVISNNVLYLFLAGNLARELNTNGNATFGHIVDVFVDVWPGGQNPIRQFGPSNPLNGLGFDSNFVPDYVFEFQPNSENSLTPPSWSARYGTFPTPSGGGFTPLGTGVAGSGTLTGGTNPDGIEVTIDNHNIAGVTLGCAASSGAGVTTGVEWAIPLLALGSPTGCFALTVIVRTEGSISTVSNQVLAPLPAGTCPPGTAPMVNFANIAGDQFFTVCPGTSGVPDGPAPGLALVGLGPNPTRGDRVPVSFTLGDSRPARLEVVDVTGRVVRAQTVHAVAGGAGAVDLAAGARLAPGVYWVRLSQGASRVVRSLCIVR
jgi:hypothetical protein